MSGTRFQVRGVQWGKCMHLRGAATDKKVFMGSDFFLCSHMLIP